MEANSQYESGSHLQRIHKSVQFDVEGKSAKVIFPGGAYAPEECVL